MPRNIYLKPDFEIDLLHNSQYERIIGIDEVGRGCWAGPVTVGGYIYDLNSEFIVGVTDSKQLTLKQRLSIFPGLSLHNHILKFGDVRMIDKYGIGKTIEKLILQLVTYFDDGKTFFLIDGQFRQDFGINSKKMVKGDGNFYSIAAASIIAKVSRDRLMSNLEKQYTGYGFDKHKGYGTRFHRDALSTLGISEIHRRSYKPIQAINEKKFEKRNFNI